LGFPILASTLKKKKENFHSFKNETVSFENGKKTLQKLFFFTSNPYKIQISRLKTLTVIISIFGNLTHESVTICSRVNV